MPTEEQCLSAVQALYRVRAVEKPAGPDGRREVWHQGSRGAELLSTVDATGRLEEQELVLFNEVIYWWLGGGLKTGKSLRREDVSSRGNTLWDAEPAPERLERCHKALAGYTGDDRYLQHLRGVVSGALAGVEWNDSHVVTRPAQPGESQDNPMPPREGPVKKLLSKLAGAVKKK
ncbi:MAG: hypothetical protein JNK82_10310 [Myxococcaceae bacterium]|nr:hypothetical protein [Myxococcaceae bacterium]